MSTVGGDCVSTVSGAIDEHPTESTNYDSKSTILSSIEATVSGVSLNMGLFAFIRLIIFSMAIFNIIFGNALTIWAVLTTDRLRNKTYALTTSLAASDFLLGIIYLDYVVHEAVAPTACGMATYKSLVRPIERLVLYSSFLHIPAIAFDRFVAILHPLHYEDRMTPQTIAFIVTIIWLVAAATSLPSYVGFATSLVPPQSCIVTYWPMFETIVELLYYVINSSVVAFVYLKIWSIAMHHEMQQQQQQLQQCQMSRVVSKSVRFSATTAAYEENHAIGSPRDDAATSVSTAGDASSFGNCCHRQKLVKKHRATRTIMIILGVCIIMWFPYMFARFLGFVVIGPRALSIVQLIQAVGSILNSVSYGLNVFIYSLTNTDFSRAFKRILHVGTNQIHSFNGANSDA